MALCLNCGQNIDTVSRTCPNCGTLIQTDTITNKDAIKGYGKKTYDNMAVINIISYIIPIIGFILYFKNKDESDYVIILRNSMIGTIIYLVIITLCIVFLMF